jgi:hypothetical protein
MNRFSFKMLGWLCRERNFSCSIYRISKLKFTSSANPCTCQDLVTPNPIHSR